MYPRSVQIPTLRSLLRLDALLDKNRIDWQITEAYPPKVRHQDVCHQNGTCVDANCIGGCNASQIKIFLTEATQSGWRAEYEVKTQAEHEALLNAGVPATGIRVVSAITAPHFSLYKK